MQNTLLNKYFEFKKKSFLAYSSVFYKLYSIENDSIWKNEEEYESILKEIFDLYFNKYYLKAKSELNDLNTKNYNEDEFKLALSLALIADTYKDKYKELKEKHRQSLYNLTIIIYIIINVDKEISAIEGIVPLNNILDILKKYFKYIKQEDIMNKNPFIIDILGNKIKDSKRSISKFFRSLDSKEAYNTFSKYDYDSYFVKFNYTNDLLDKYSEVDVERVYEKYKFEEEFYEVSYELALITLLKEYIAGGNVKSLILPITGNYLKDEKHIEFIKQTFGNGFIKEKIRFSIVYSEYQKNRDIYNPLRALGFKLVLYMDSNDMILDYSNIRIDLSIYTRQKFIDNNPKFLDFTRNKDIECMIIDQNNYISELELLERCKEE